MESEGEVLPVVRSRWSAVLLVLALLAAGCSTSTDSGGSSKGADGKPGVTGKAKGQSGADADGAEAGLTDEERAHLIDDGETTWDVTYSSDTTVVSGKALDALKKSDDDAGTYVFDAKAAKAADLDLGKGRVLLLAGQALRRITASDTSGGDITLRTEQASLADAIDEGEVAWDVPLDFDFRQFATSTKPDRSGGGTPKPKSSSLRPGDVGSTRPQLTQISMAMPDGRTVPVQSGGDIGEAILDSIEVKPEDGSVAWTYESHGNKYQFRLTAHGESVDILVVVSRSVGGDAKMAFRGEGSIGSLRSTSSNSYSGGALTGGDVGIQNLNVDLKLSATAAGAGASPVDLKIPVPMLTYTWLVGPVPVTVDLTAQIVGNIKAQANASVRAESKISYKGSAGFQYHGTNVSASGDTDVDNLDPEPADSAAPMGLDVDAQFGLAFPTISLSIFGQGLVPSLHTGAVIGSNLRWGGPAAGFPASSLCKSGYVRIEVVAGYDLKILGRTLASDKYPLYENRKDGRSDGCPPEGE